MGGSGSASTSTTASASASTIAGTRTIASVSP